MTTEATPQGERMYKVSEIASRFSVTPYTVRMWIKEGTLVASKPGGQWRISHSEMVRLANKKHGVSND